MAPDRNRQLLQLFDEASPELDGEAFTTGVLARTSSRRYRIVAVAASFMLVLLVTVWVFSAPLQEFAMLLAQGLATPLLDLGDNRLTWVFTPVNNIASLLVLIAKLSRMGWKKLGRTSFAF